MATLSSHVLDTSIGCPAAHLAVRLDARRAGGWVEVARATTDDAGRIRALAEVAAGTYRLRFDVAPYFAARHAACFFPWIEIVFTVADAAHYHVPLLVSPFGYSTYRGS